MSKPLRASMLDYAAGVDTRPYPGELPDELKKYHYYVGDAGHAIMCVLEMHWPTDEPYMYEIPVPVKYVLEQGYRIDNDFVIVEAPYNMRFGLDVDDKYFEF
ncbi:hypothetical protein COLU111180_06160 [Cohnella lubricantis]|uniref:Uncharacterized protein n=1 Tax=Cohnella lubricantis TaxID=2163172 RepID=A0A841TDY0_9BACL|nr:hypothetical protein [Cohnella lubricantis]MBB6677538.1 hypothetical protein [Cohnella lubricantis]MBP2116576.1 hypothetical protein [Cohnella lubricantis]